ncbi:MAG: hypothetical protein ABL864_05650 [Terricaulis sp.]
MADWLMSGGYHDDELRVPDAKVKAELQRVAHKAQELESALSVLSEEAEVRLQVSLSHETLVPANLAATLSRLRADIAALVDPISRAAQFKANKPANELLKHLFRQCIGAWVGAVGVWPTKGVSEDVGAHSPIPNTLRQMAAAVLGNAPSSMNDSAFLVVLRAEQDKESPIKGGPLALARAQHIPSPKRGRPKK